MPGSSDLRAKIRDKMDQKFKGGFSKERLAKAFGDYSVGGFMTAEQFQKGLEKAGNPLSDAEAAALFNFWDTCGERQPAQGAVEVALAVQDIVESQEEYVPAFRSGEDWPKANKGAKGNLPSQSGGIFGGGSYAADADRENQTARGAPRAPPLEACAPPMQPPSSSRPRGNQSSIAGGIFGEGEAAPPPSSRANRSNQSSIEGGIFGGATPQAQWVPPRSGKYSNQSSIPGGIFGSD